MIAFVVADMTCGHCVSTLTQALKHADPEARIQIDRASHRVQVEPAAADAQALAAAIVAAGYTPVAAMAQRSEAAAPERGSCCGHCR
ncbi:MAG: chaperonin [Pseudomonadota bacterium]